MIVKTCKSTLLGVLFLASLGTAATSVSFSLSASSGDKEFDLTLQHINSEAKQSLPAFYGSMHTSFGTPRETVDLLLHTHHLSPAEAFMAIRLSILVGKPVDVVVARYKKHHKKGWGAVARSLGIKPGSKAFHQLKDGGTVVLDRTRKERSALELRVSNGQASMEVHADKKGGPKEHPGNGHGKGHGKGKK